MNTKNWTTTSRWLTAVLVAIIIASAGLIAYNAHAYASNSSDDKDQQKNGNWTNGSTQKGGYPYPHSYNMTYGFEKDDRGQGDDKNGHDDDDNQTSTNSTTSSCTGGGEAVINYTGTGSTSSTIVRHNLGAFPRVIYILDLTNSPSYNVDGITTIISTSQVVYVESGNDAYAPVSLTNNNIVNSTTIDVGQIFNQISQQTNSKAVNSAGTNYQLIALNFASPTCSSSSSSSSGDDDDEDHDHG
ncbi:MAG TPA: hypothetical protein VJ792_06755 [Candidatus Nitrosotalea sp.]|nr:hypothetical protein [Candidatus Nitrosotalea sp.]